MVLWSRTTSHSVDGNPPNLWTLAWGQLDVRNTTYYAFHSVVLVKVKRQRGFFLVSIVIRVYFCLYFSSIEISFCLATTIYTLPSRSPLFRSDFGCLWHYMWVKLSYSRKKVWEGFGYESYLAWCGVGFFLFGSFLTRYFTCLRSLCSWITGVIPPSAQSCQSLVTKPPVVNDCCIDSTQPNRAFARRVFLYSPSLRSILWVVSPHRNGVFFWDV